MGYFIAGLLVGIVGTIGASEKVQKNFAKSYAYSQAMLMNEQIMHEHIKYVMQELIRKGKLEAILMGMPDAETDSIIREATQQFISLQMIQH